jgi:hypothetical protein
MMVGILRAWSCVALAIMGCGASKPRTEPAPPPTVDAGVEAAAPVAEEDPPGPVEKPFANNSAEAMSMVNQAVQSKEKAIHRCVDAYRLRKQDRFAKLEVTMAVDMEGTLVAVAIPAKSPHGDKEAADCIFTALKRAAFPRSKAGVIQVNKTFDFEAVYPK